MVKVEEKLQKPYLSNYVLLTAHDLWQFHYQILLTILLKKFRKFNENMYMIIKKHTELDAKIACAVLMTQKLKMI